MTVSPNNFTVQLPETRRTTSTTGSVSNTTIVDHRYAKEYRDGAYRHKPLPDSDGYIRPTGFTFDRIAWQRAYGVIQDSNGIRYDFSVPATSPASMKLELCNRAGIPTGTQTANTTKAQIDARLKLKNASFNAPLAIKEAGLAGEMFLSMSKRIFRLAKALRKKDPVRAAQALGFKAVKDTSKTASGYYLEYKYGVKPMMQDMFGACKALNENPADHWMVTVRGKSVRKWKGTKEIYPQTSSLSRCIATYEVETGCKIRIDAMPDNPGLISLAQLGITNPAELGWEIIPFSFVVDWFLPVGDYLSSLDATLGWKIKGYSESNFYKFHSRFSGVRSGTLRVNSWNAFYEGVSLDRSAGTSVPFPFLGGIRLNGPTKNQVLTGLALLRSASNLPISRY